MSYKASQDPMLWGADCFQVDDLVLTGGEWRRVVRVNRQSVRVVYPGLRLVTVQWWQIYGRIRDGVSVPGPAQARALDRE